MQTLPLYPRQTVLQALPQEFCLLDAEGLCQEFQPAILLICDVDRNLFHAPIVYLTETREQEEKRDV
jgi:hypothetical protein